MHYAFITMHSSNHLRTTSEAPPKQERADYGKKTAKRRKRHENETRHRRTATERANTLFCPKQYTFPTQHLSSSMETWRGQFRRKDMKKHPRLYCLLSAA